MRKLYVLTCALLLSYLIHTTNLQVQPATDPTPKAVFADVNDTAGSAAPNLFDSAKFMPQSFVQVERFIEILGPGIDDGGRSHNVRAAVLTDPRAEHFGATGTAPGRRLCGTRPTSPPLI